MVDTSGLNGVTHGNFELEQFLRNLALAVGFPLVSGNIYYVIPSADPNYTQFVGQNAKTYTDGSAMIQTTIGAALTASVASRGDLILVAAGYTETVTAAITMSKIGVSVVGLGEGLSRPQITGNGTIDAFNITAANCLLQNIAFPAPETDDQTADVNVAAAGVTLRNLYSIGSQTSKNKTDIITVTSAGHDLLVEGCRAYNTVVDCVSWLSLEGAANRPVIRDNVVQGQFSTGVLMDEATATLATIQRNIFKNTKAATAVVTFTTGNTTGVMSFNHLSGRHTTFASNLVAGTGMDFFENRVVEEAALNGGILPVADAD